MRYPDEFPIAQLEMTNREVSACRKAGISTIGDLRRAKRPSLLVLPGVGKITVRELLEWVPALESGFEDHLEHAFDIVAALARINEVVAECGLTPVIRDNQILLLKELT